MIIHGRRYPYVHHRPHRRHQGAVYLAALGAAMLLTVIGLAAIAVARAGTRSHQTTRDMRDARLAAESVVDLVMFATEKVADWRTRYEIGRAHV